MDVWTALSSPGTHIVIAAPFIEEPATIPSVDEQAEVMRFAGDAVVPLWLAATYLGSNVVLNGLNWYWFAKMVETIRKRFEPGAKQRGGREKIEANGTATGAVKGKREVRMRKS